MISHPPLRGSTRHILALTAGTLSFLAAPVRAVTTDADDGTLFAAKYVVNNNVWGKQGSPGGHQSVYASGSVSPLTWGAKYNWPVGEKSYEVKAYPSIISGWHWGTWSRNSGLPVRIAERQSVLTSGSFSVVNPGVQNVAYDCWFHLIGNPGKDSQPTDELMIWVARFGGAGPLGKLEGRVELGGATWEVYRGRTAWNVFSFIRVSNVDAWAIDIRDFTDYLVSVKGWLEKEKYLTSVQFGSEIFKTDGDGGLEVTGYRCDVR